MVDQMPTDAASVASAPSGRASAGDWVKLARPRQWIKNLVIFAGLLFTANQQELDDVLRVGVLFAVFCAISSAGYLINDALDHRRDREHPVKRQRPIAAGRIAPGSAIAVAVALLALGIGTAAWLGWPVAAVSAVYLLVTLSYSLLFKHHVIIDLLAIAAGFLVRALAGTVVLGVALSPWLFICLSFLALMLGFGKRRHELTLLDEHAATHRPVLQDYSRGFIDQMLMMMSASSIITYAIYTINSETAHAHPALVYTMPPVLYALMRYLYLVQHRGSGGQPEEMILTDRPIGISILLWGAAVVAIFLWM